MLCTLCGVRDSISPLKNGLYEPRFITITKFFRFLFCFC